MTIVVGQQVASALVWGWGIAPAAAHGPLAASAAVEPDTLWRSWSFDPHVLAPRLLVFGLYARGVRRLWRRAGRGRGVTPYRMVSFAAGASTLFVALISPLDRLGETMLSAHMHGGLLGALITLARVHLYDSYHGRAALWGLSSLEDQQLAGLLMWVPMGIVYLGTCLTLASRLVVGDERVGGVQQMRHLA